MSKIILVQPDTSIKIIVPNSKKYGDGKKEYSECLALKKEINPNWFITDQLIDKSDLESHKQLYVESGTTEIKKDLGWEVMLMPDQLIKQKHLKAIQKEIDLELESTDPDILKILKKQSEIKKLQQEPAENDNSSSFWIQKAIDGLARASKPKPQIEEKLAAKLEELTNG